jgi:membrane protein YqaA with SNARE-associated domain
MDGIVEAVGIYAATIVVGVLSGLVPIVNGELFLIGAVKLLAEDVTGALVVAVLLAFGQMTAKVILYHAARRATDLPTGKFAEKLRRARERVGKWRNKPLTILFLSAVLGLPPFYLVTLAAGILKVPFVTFVWLGLVGRVIRFTSLALIINYA